MQYSTDQLNHLIHHRRTVKTNHYTDQPVDDSIILQMLENARWAPTHGMTEPWHFVVFTGEGRNKFARFQAELYKQETTAEHFLDSKYQKLLNTPLQASHIILIGMSRQPSGKIPESEEICAVACAVQNMMLTATAYGVGCYWSTGGMTYREAMKEFLGLRPEDKCLGMLYVGNYEGEMPATIRKDIAEKTTWVR